MSLREFAISASNQHLGMQGVERFGPEDFDRDDVAGELTVGDITAMALRQATLPIPAAHAAARREEAQAARGEALFGQMGCAQCHVPALPLRSTVFCDPQSLQPAGQFDGPGATGVCRPQGRHRVEATWCRCSAISNDTSSVTPTGRTFADPPAHPQPQ